MVLACVLLAGCSSESPTPRAQSSTAGTTPTTTSTSVGTPSATASGAAVPSGTASAAATRSAGAAPSAKPLATTAPGTASPARATAPGTYTADTSGTYSAGGGPQDASGTATLTVSPLRNGAQRSTLHTEQTETTQDLLVRDKGTYLAALTVGLPVNKEFRPSPAALLFPAPATVGARWSWTSTSTDGASTVSADNKIARTETLTIGGQRVATTVLQTHLVITGDVSYTADVTTWVATAYHLPVKDHTVGNGSFGLIPFSTDITSVLRSVRPA